VTNPSKKKGSAWEVRLVSYLNEHGFPLAERRVQAGALDKGDIAGLPFVIEAKNCKAITLSAWMDEAEKEAKAAGTPRFAVVFPRRSHVTAKAFAVIPLWLLAELMQEATS